ncbi:MAG: FAD-binding oxidoreductase [Candidatus Woesearchaeota archaeon]
MLKYKVKILEIDLILRNTIRLVCEKPEGYKYLPGQAASIWLPGILKPKPFTMTGIESDNFLEFIIRIYHDGGGFTVKLSQLKVGDYIEISKAWGKMFYKGDGVFIAGGCGITPFIAILRQMKNKKLLTKDTVLFYSCKSSLDVIHEKELKYYLGDNAIFTLTQESLGDYCYGRIDAKLIESKLDNFSKIFYLCGPNPFINEMKNFLKDKGVKEIVTEL